VRIRLVALALVGLTLWVAGCGSDSGGQPTHPSASTPESGTQAYGGFPGAGNPGVPDVTTTPGSSAENSPGKAGGGSSATCIGC